MTDYGGIDVKILNDKVYRLENSYDDLEATVASVSSLSRQRELDITELQRLVERLELSVEKLADKLDDLSSDCQSNWEDTAERGDFLDLKETVEDLQYRLADVEQLLEERNEK